MLDLGRMPTCARVGARSRAKRGKQFITIPALVKALGSQAPGGSSRAQADPNRRRHRSGHGGPARSDYPLLVRGLRLCGRFCRTRRSPGHRGILGANLTRLRPRAGVPRGGNRRWPGAHLSGVAAEIKVLRRTANMIQNFRFGKGAFTTINVLGASSTFVSGINNQGVIVRSYGKCRGGADLAHAFVAALEQYPLSSIHFNNGGCMNKTLTVALALLVACLGLPLAAAQNFQDEVRDYPPDLTETARPALPEDLF